MMLSMYEEVKKLISDLENKISGLEKGIEGLKSDLTQTFTHNFDELINKQEEAKVDEPKEEQKEILEDF